MTFGNPLPLCHVGTVTETEWRMSILFWRTSENSCSMCAAIAWEGFTNGLELGQKGTVSLSCYHSRTYERRNGKIL
jgi:hypothetical protein